MYLVEKAVVWALVYYDKSKNATVVWALVDYDKLISQYSNLLLSYNTVTIFFHCVVR